MKKKRETTTAEDIERMYDEFLGACGWEAMCTGREPEALIFPVRYLHKLFDYCRKHSSAGGKSQ